MAGVSADVASRAAALADEASQASQALSAAQSQVSAISGRVSEALASGDVAGARQAQADLVDAEAVLARAQQWQAQVMAAHVAVNAELQRERWAEQLEAAKDLVAGDVAAVAEAKAHALALAAELVSTVRALSARGDEITSGRLRIEELSAQLEGRSVNRVFADPVAERVFDEIPWLRAAAAWVPTN